MLTVLVRKAERPGDTYEQRHDRSGKGVIPAMLHKLLTRP